MPRASTLLKEQKILLLHRFLSKMGLFLQTLYISMEILAFSLNFFGSIKVLMLFFLEILCYFLILIHEVYNLQKKDQDLQNRVRTYLKVFGNLLILVLFTEIHNETLIIQKMNANTIQLVHLEFWLISFSFTVYFNELAIRYPMILIQYLYFKYRTIFTFDLNADFFLENVYVILIILVFFLIEIKITKIAFELYQELENFQTLFLLSEFSSQGFAILGGDQDILYSSPGFSKTLLKNGSKESAGLGIEEKEITGKITMKLSNLKNLRVYRELEEIPLSSPRKKDYQDKSSILLPKPLISTIHDSNLLINEGVDSEENLLLKMNLKTSNIKNKSNFEKIEKTEKTEKTEKKTLKVITDQTNKEKSEIYLHDLLKKILLNENQEGSAETLAGYSALEVIPFQNPSTIHQFSQGFDRFLASKIYKFTKNFNITSSNKTIHFTSILNDSFNKQNSSEKKFILDSKPLVYFGQEDNTDDFFSIFLLPFKFHDQKAIFLSVRSLLKDISLHYIEKVQNFQEKFMRTMSHELRTPINGSLTLLEEILKNRNYSPEGLENYLSPAICNLKIFHNTVNDIFDFSKLFLNNFQLSFIYFSVQSLISEISMLIKPLGLRKGIEILINKDPNLPKRLFSDPLRIRQILLNLLTNSLRFTIKGLISIQVKLQSLGLLEFVVSDTGIGMSEEKQKSLFKMTFSKEGTIGFGLTISNLIAKELNYHKKGLIINSKEGQGCSMSFLVSYSAKEQLQNGGSPLIESLEPNELNEHSQVYEKTNSLKEIDLEKKFFDYIKQKSDPNGISKWKNDVLIRKKCLCFDVLIVDDNEFNLMALKLLLEKHKLLVDEARNGEEAVAKIKESLEKAQNIEGHHCHYKLIFMDLDMPVKNGFQASEELMVIFSNFDVNIPIIACTAFLDDEKEKCLKTGMNGFITKPISSVELEGVLKIHLES